ncbi:hypothetical protein HN014_17925 [Aquimarina sp. TRL1]|uniref:hypothetical protein n=1 Tax=Aquimarina sp. (strain TRL1) TaxID=2736252 RepID=UPI00158874D3|nr:hypothetical protein [Aquimarina sp. TRL1]QKX06714.1 hypothetical protein HN014_17925 [Aquimarina sp. TRL1]
MKKNKISKQLVYVIETGILVGVSLFSLTFLTTFLWQINGLNTRELVLLSVIAGVYLIVLTVLINYVRLNPFFYQLKQQFSKRCKRRNAIFLVLGISILIYFILDSIVYFVDDSLAVDYWNFLISLDPQKEAENIVAYPFAIINSVVTFVFGIFGALVSFFLVKKEGKLINFKLFKKR